MSPSERVLKYLFDRTVALIGLLVLSPLLLALSVGVKLGMGRGPVLFTQKRVGKDGRLFTICKFRTMYADNYGTSVTVAGDHRIYPLGVFLRKYHLDELPEPDYTARRKPVCIISNTTKGYGVDFMEDNWKWHGGGLGKEQLDEALASLERKRRGN